MPLLNCVLIGDPETNKTQILKTFLFGKYHKGYTPDAVENDSAVVVINNKVYTLGLQDVTTYEQYDKLKSVSQQISVFLLVFSVVHPTTFNHIKSNWLPKVINEYPNVPIILVGSNVEQRYISEREANQRRGTFSLASDDFGSIAKPSTRTTETHEGTKLAKQMNAVAYLECCAGLLNEVKAIFEKAILAALASNPKLPSMETLAFMQVKEAVKTGDMNKVCEYINIVTNLNRKNKQGYTLLEQACINGYLGIARILLLSGMSFGPHPLPPEIGKFHEYVNLHNTKRPKVVYSLRDQKIYYVPKNQLVAMQQHEQIDLSENLLTELAVPPTISLKASSLILSRNKFEIFPKLQISYLKTLDLSHNSLKEIPSDIMTRLPNLESLDVAHNKLENLPSELGALSQLYTAGNPLSQILPAYRNKNEKVLYYLRMKQGQQMLPWNQVKIMLVGQEGVGKTTLLGSLQGSRYKCDTDVSTNGINITQISLSRASSLFKPSLKDAGMPCSVWDFGGKSVFHSTHRYFLSANAIYLCLYDMSKPETIDRVKYWVKQVESIIDNEGSKPILIVGTHADKITRQERAQRIAEIQQAYPGLSSNRSHVLGHFVLSLTSDEKAGLSELRGKIVEIVVSHPKMVPRNFTMMQKELAEHKRTSPYLSWSEYSSLGASIGIDEDSIQSITTLLHNAGFVVWHNTHKLRDVVVIDPQWLADSMAGVINPINQISISKCGGIVSTTKLKESMSLKFPNQDTQAKILSLLELFEIVHKMRTPKSMGTSAQDEQMLFIPALLLPSTNEPHPSIQFWQHIEAKLEFTRKFIWPFPPSGFFPHLLIRLVSLRIQVLASWMNVAVAMGRDGNEYALLQLMRGENRYYLELKVKVENEANEGKEPLIAELSYIITRLHLDRYQFSRFEAPLMHEVGVSQQSPNGTIQMDAPFEDCMRAKIEGSTHVGKDNPLVALDDIIPDLAGFRIIPPESLTIGEKLGEGTFGPVYKGTMVLNEPTAMKVEELRLRDDKNAIYEFQHELTAKSKLEHENLIKMHGITISPLRVVHELIPGPNLLMVLQEGHKLSMKWKLKLAIDIATAINYMHSHAPPVCHRNLHATHIFVASLSEDADIVGKIDSGLSPQVFHSAHPHITETAPETWGDTGSYDQRSDVFSFSIILWHLFGASNLYKTAKNFPESERKKRSGRSELQNNQIKKEKGSRDLAKCEKPEEFAFLMENGKFLPLSRQREVIRKGGRVEIHGNCHPALASLIRECWQTHPDARPSSSSIANRLIEIYAQENLQDGYIVRKKNKLSGFKNSDNSSSSLDFTKLNFNATAWKSVTLPVETTITSMLEVGTDVWMGTSIGLVFVVDNKTHQMTHKISLSATSSPQRGIKIICANHPFLWISVGTDIHILSTKTYDEIAAPVMNLHLCSNMVFLPAPREMWIADTSGYVSIWDTLTMKKCFRFQIHASHTAQAMEVLNDNVWAAVGKELIVIQSNSLESTSISTAHKERINLVVAVPHTNQVWTFSNDGAVRVWKLNSDDAKKWQIQMLHEWTMASPAKSARVMSDGKHICVGASDGSLSMVDIKTFKFRDIPTPHTNHNHSVQCTLDTKSDLWCGLDATDSAIMYYAHDHENKETRYN